MWDHNSGHQNGINKETHSGIREALEGREEAGGGLQTQDIPTIQEENNNQPQSSNEKLALAHVNPHMLTLTSSMGSGSGNTGSCHRSCSCKTTKASVFSGRSKVGKWVSLCSGADLLLRKQFWITLMMKDAASFSLRPGLNRCLSGRQKTT